MKSSWFQKVRPLAENYDKWFILSAKYRLVNPETEIESYDEIMKTKNGKKGKNIEERMEWADGVLAKLLPVITSEDKITIYAGLDYREFIEPKLKKMGFSIEVPLEGVKQGDQGKELNKALDWYKKQGFSFDLWNKMAAAGRIENVK